MAVMLRWTLIVLLVLLSCLSTTAIVPRYSLPVSLPSIVQKAQSELDAGRLNTAAVLLKNASLDSPEKDELLKRVQTKLQEQFDAAKKNSNPTLEKDLGQTLAALSGQNYAALVQTPWPEVPNSSANSGPEDWLKGTVTIQVNKGIKMDHGVGIPEIVIGSGFFVSADGYILTNHHVVEEIVEPGHEGYTKLTVRLPGSRGEKLPAKVVGWDKNHDLALLKVEYKPEFVFRFSERGLLKPGQKILALGSPGGLEATVTEGIVSAMKRPLLPMGDVIQVDVPVNPGNSGGPLVDEHGEVVGVIFAGIQQFQGVNFAIPGKTAKKLLPRLKQGGRAVLPWIGAGLDEDLQGLQVTYVLPQSPADWAGLKVGDQIVAVMGTPYKDVAQIQDLMLDWGTSAVLPWTIKRDGKEIVLLIHFVERTDEPVRVAMESDLVANVLPLAFGMFVEDVGTPVDRQFRVKKVISGSSADELGLSENDPITVLDYTFDKDNKAIFFRIFMKKRLGGYLESSVQLGTSFTGRQMI